MRRQSKRQPNAKPSVFRPLGVRLSGVGRTALLGAGILAAPAALAVELVYDADDQAVAVATDGPSLGSVLVQTREGDPLEAAEPTELEPISQVSEHEPELADPPERDAPPQQAQPASLEEDAPAVTGRVATLPEDGRKTLTAATDSADPTEGPRPARFHGVTPGDSTRAELIEAWGEPVRTAAAKGETDGGEVLGYDLAPFEQVESLVEGGVVAVVRVTMADDSTVSQLVERLRLSQITPVAINDPTSGALLAVAFPEKGLTLLVVPSTSTTPNAEVSHLVLEPIDGRAFVLRCEQRPANALSARLADLQTAIRFAPKDAHAHWLMAEQHLAAGQAAAAETAATEAVRLEPFNPAYRLTMAEAHRAAGEFDKAVIETRKVLDDDLAPRIVRAQSLDLMGRLAALGAQNIASKTIDFHNAAIVIADELATSTDSRERRLAKDVLVSAHLAVAREIASRDYTDKATTVAEWIGRASGIAEERIDADGGGLELRLQVAREALAALAQMRPTKDPGPWIQEAQQTADALLSEAEDPLFRARVHWELGEAYQHAVRIEHLRGDAQQALSYGTRSISELSSGAEPRTTSPAAEQLVGKLYFYLGAVNAVHRQDHAEAAGWYDKGREILTAERPDSDFVVPRRQGEELVSMGVSYWSQGDKDLAIELTQAGARLMERGVAAGVIDEADLAVPYGNLTTMYKKVNNGAKALEYDRLVKGVSEVAPAATPKAQPVAQQQRQAPRQQVTQQPPTPQETPRVSSRLGRPTARRTMSR